MTKTLLELSREVGLLSYKGVEFTEDADRYHRARKELADRYEQIVELCEALRKIAGYDGPYSVPFPEQHNDYGAFAVMTARRALKGE